MGASQSTQQPPAYADLEGVYGAGDSDTSQQADANGEPELDELHNVNGALGSAEEIVHEGLPPAMEHFLHSMHGHLPLQSPAPVSERSDSQACLLYTSPSPRDS